MDVTDHVIMLFLSAILIIGGYQLYFFPQNHRIFNTRSMLTPIDKLFSYDPRWVWGYSFVYYPMILSITLTMNSWRQFGYIAGSFVILLCIQFVIFMLFPVETPAEWRQSRWQCFSQKFLDLVQRYDKRTNSFPSMHVSIATLTELHLSRNVPELFPYGVIFPIIIAWSALKTKQHFFVDIIPGAILGYIVFSAWIYYFNPI